MECVKSKIQIAGAGAGKTHDLSEIVLNQEIQENKNIYVITYTNFARKNIEDSIKKQKGYIPNNIKISTIHIFLLNEVIYPYSKYILKRKYTKAVSIPLPNEIVQISNLYCPKNQRQVSKSSEKGSISYIDVQDKEFNNIFNKVKENEGLIYIKEKNELFETRSKEEYNATSFKRKIN